MINSTYAKAYTEVLEIIKYFSKQEYEKIPKEKIEFYKKNRDKNYNFKINPTIDLDKQNISKEANAIIINLYKDYYATEEQKIKIDQILKLNQEKKEQEKLEKYNPDNIFKNKPKEIDNIAGALNEEEENKLIKYKKEKWYQKIIKKILSFFQKNK